MAKWDDTTDPNNWKYAAEQAAARSEKKSELAGYGRRGSKSIRKKDTTGQLRLSTGQPTLNIIMALGGAEISEEQGKSD